MRKEKRVFMAHPFSVGTERSLKGNTWQQPRITGGRITGEVFSFTRVSIFYLDFLMSTVNMYCFYNNDV